MNDSRTAGTTTGRQYATYHNATSPWATQHREVTPRTAIRRAWPALLQASLVCLIAIGCGSMLLTACADYDDFDFVSDRDTMMHTQLVISASGSNSTRMSVAATQSDETFRGMRDIKLIPFFKSGTNENPITASDNILNTGQSLGDMESFQFDSNSKLYDISLPYGTNALLVYGRSMAATTRDLTPSWDNYSPANITFSPVQFVSSVTAGHAAGWTDDEDTRITTGDNIIAYLNSIFKANEDYYDWSDESNYPILYGLYPMVQEMKAGSTASVKAFVQEIYEALKESASVDYIQTVLKAILVEDLEEGNLPSSLPDNITLPDNCIGYPANCGLPDGTAVVQWNEGEFVAVTNQNNLGAMNVDVTNFVKPAELWYRTNSRINTDNVSRLADYQSLTTWAEVLGTYAEQNGSVKATTKSVAVRQQMQYAVGRLDLRLEAKNGDETLTRLVDKAGTAFDLTDLPITGILVGQQSPVDFLFQSKWQQEGDPLYTIYDSAIEGTINAETDVYTHTLVLETLKDQTVNIAIELQNNSDESILTQAPGDTEDQIIPKGCKFYLVGQLVVKSGNDTDGYTYIDGYDETIPAKNRVFCQDHVTKVTFTVQDLTKAYYVIPPLSSADLEISIGTKDWIMSTPAGFEMQ